MNRAHLCLCALWLIGSCTRDKTTHPSASGYPDDIAAIIETRCSVAGCHNTASKDAAAGLDLSTWEKMLAGSNGGSVVIPYAHLQSSLFQFVNTDSALGVVATPTMPYNRTPLLLSEVITLRDWIDAGAPNRDGFVKFSDNPQRRKIYVTNQGCDLVSVIDAESKLVMRYIDVGISSQIEGPHMVKVSPDGKFWCVTFVAGTVLQKFSATTDQLLGQVDIGVGSWNTVSISQDGTKAYVVDWSTDGKFRIVDLVNYTIIGGAGGLFEPHGSALSADDKTLYLTGQRGNFIYKVDVSDPDNIDYDQIAVDGSGTPIPSSLLDIHEIIFSPDYSKYFLACQKTGEVRVMNTANDSLLAVIPVGPNALEMAISPSSPYLFISCTDDLTTFPGTRGAVYIIDYNTLSVVKAVYAGHQPHGLAINDVHDYVLVANRNQTSDGPAPHHSSSCGGRNGNVTAIDLNTLELVPGFKQELSVDPYIASFR